MAVPIAAIDVGGVVDGIMRGLDGLFTSDEERAAAKLQLAAELQKPHILQAMTNMQEAQHGHWFVAGWRPAIGWVCALGLAYGVIVRDLAVVLVSIFSDYDLSDLPQINLAQIIGLVVTLLGVGTQRTVEKLQGVDTRKVE